MEGQTPGLTLVEVTLFAAAALGALAIAVGPFGFVSAIMFGLAGVALIGGGLAVLRNYRGAGDHLLERARRHPGYRRLTHRALPAGPRWGYLSWNAAD